MTAKPPHGGSGVLPHSIKTELIFTIEDSKSWKATVETINRIKAEYGNGNNILRIEIKCLECLTDEEHYRSGENDRT